MKVLGIESSCDETGLALVEIDGAQPPRLLADALYSQAGLVARRLDAQDFHEALP
jgi:N6-L-threonylcarbamoyladenine synthase